MTKNILSYLLDKRSLTISVTAILYIVFHKPLEKLLTNILVDNILAHVESIWYNDIFFALISIFVICLALYQLGSFTTSSNIALLFILIAIYYCYYRFVSDVWTFTPLLSFNGLKYADLILVTTLSNLVLLIEPRKTQTQENLEAFIDDEPLGISKKDDLGYANYAASLAEKIEGSYFNKSFSIGINGKWGLGKTSFIDLLKRELKGKGYIEINFNPWNSSNPKTIIQDFFETMQEAVSQHHSSLSRLLILYSNKLISLDDNAASRVVQASARFLTGFESINSLFEEINESLRKVNRKLLVFIDDLDRLDKEEIVEVIRLIRNTANFHNTIFIVTKNFSKKYSK